MSVFASQSERFSPASPIDGLGLGPMGSMLGQFLLPMLGNATGLQMMGLTGQSMFDRSEQMRLTQMQKDLMDRLGSNSAERGAISNLVGHAVTAFAGPGAWNNQTKSWFNNFYNQYGSQALVMASQFAPELVDSVLGPGGGRIAGGHQMTYALANRFDAMTGRLGYSVDDGERFVNRFMDNLYKNGPNPGVSPLQAGTLYRELSRMGYVGPAANADGFGLSDALSGQNVSALAEKALARTHGAADRKDLQRFYRDGKVRGDITAAELRTLPADVAKELGSLPEVSAQLANFNADKATDNMRQWLKAFKGLRQVMGNISASELPNVLSVMSGNMAAYGSVENASIAARQLVQTAQLSGVGPQQAGQQAMLLGQLAASAGLDRSFGTMAATMANAAAIGFNVDAGNMMWGGMTSAAQMRSIVGQATLRGHASQLGNRIGFLNRLQGLGVSMSGDLAAYHRIVNGTASAEEIARHGGAGMFHGQALGQVSDAQLINMIQAENPNMSTAALTNMLGQTRTNQRGLANRPQADAAIAESQMRSHEERRRNALARTIRSGNATVDAAVAAAGSEAVFSMTYAEQTANGGAGARKASAGAMRAKLEEIARTGTPEQRRAARRALETNLEARLDEADGDVARQVERANIVGENGEQVTGEQLNRTYARDEVRRRKDNAAAARNRERAQRAARGTATSVLGGLFTALTGVDPGAAIPWSHIAASALGGVTAADKEAEENKLGGSGSGYSSFTDTWNWLRGKKKAPKSEAETKNDIESSASAALEWMGLKPAKPKEDDAAAATASGKPAEGKTSQVVEIATLVIKDERSKLVLGASLDTVTPS